MYWFFIAAVAAAGIGGYFLYSAHQARGRISTLLAVETSTTDFVHQMHRTAVEAAGVGAYRERVELEGVVVAGPSGALTSEVSGTECVWHRHKVTRHTEEVRRDKDGRRQTSKRKEKVADNTSREAFVLRDDSGEITIVPVSGVEHAHKSVSEFRDSNQRDEGAQISFGKFSLSLPSNDRGGRTLGYQYEEWLLKPGTRVFVSGEVVDRNGTLEVRAPEDGTLLITTRSEEELLADGRTTAERGRLFGYGGLGVAAVCAIVGVVGLLV